MPHRTENTQRIGLPTPVLTGTRGRDLAASLERLILGLRPALSDDTPPVALATLVAALRPRASDVAASLLNASAAPMAGAPESGLTTLRPGRLRRALEHTEGAVARVEALVEVLERRPRVRQHLRRVVASTVGGATEESSPTGTTGAGRRVRHLLSETGIPETEGLVSGVLRRLGQKVLPPHRDRRAWHDLFAEVFSHDGDADWVAAIPTGTLARLHAALTADAPEDTWAHLANEARAATTLLAHRLAVLGVDPALRRYYDPAVSDESPFILQAHALARWSAAPHAMSHAQDARAHLDACEATLYAIRAAGRTRGTSVALTQASVRGHEQIRRLRALLDLLTADQDAAGTAFAALAVDLVDGESGQRSIRRFLVDGTDLLALRVTEHAARTGEHYAASTRSELAAMARSAAGAGLIIALMALVKLLIGAAALPPVWASLLTGANYAAGFVLIHLMHFTVATKQPAMTAATFAVTLGEASQGRAPLDRLAELTAAVTRTQLVAILGNVCVALPASLLIAWGWAHSFGTPLTPPAKAERLLAELHPWQSLALLHAALAGVCLFLSGLASGYFDNACVFLRVPERLRDSAPLRRLLGAERTARVAAYLENNLGAVAGNALFGFMLAGVGFVGTITGLPLDIRHVAFSSAFLAHGAATLPGITPWEIAAGVAGVALIACTNLAVSFSLALHTAMRARGVRFLASLRFGRVLRQHFVRQPSSFFWPPR